MKDNDYIEYNFSDSNFSYFIIKYEAELQKLRIQELNCLSLMIASGNYCDLELAFQLKKSLPYISYFFDEEDKCLLEFCGLTNKNFEYFRTFESLSNDLKPVINECKYYIFFRAIFKFFEFYMAEFFFSKFNTKSSLLPELDKNFKLISRQEKEDRFFKGLNDEVILEIEEDAKIFKETFLSLGYSFKKNELAPNIRRFTNYPHKTWIRIMYNFLLPADLDKDAGDFKVFFYDLLEILIIDKTLFIDTEHEKYPTIRMSKIKKIESLLVLKKT